MVNDGSSILPRRSEEQWLRIGLHARFLLLLYRNTYSETSNGRKFRDLHDWIIFYRRINTLSVHLIEYTRQVHLHAKILQKHICFTTKSSKSVVYTIS